MNAPRRHTRRLLLPPGWVVLGFLLLLMHRQQVRVEYKLVADLRQQPWQPVAMLLAAIGPLIFYRLAHLRPSSR